MSVARRNVGRNHTRMLVGILVVKRDDGFDIDRNAAREGTSPDSCANSVERNNIVPFMVMNITLQRNSRTPKVPLEMSAFSSGGVQDHKCALVARDSLLVAVVNVVIITMRMAFEVLACDDVFGLFCAFDLVIVLVTRVKSFLLRRRVRCKRDSKKVTVSPDRKC